VSKRAKAVVRSKHAESYILARRINDKDPKNDPTPEQLKAFATATAKDWESMDRLLNNWKPSNETIQSMDLDGRIAEEIPARPESKPEKPERPD
jgi:hypothetical protein